MSNITRRQKIKEYLEKEVIRNSKMKENINNLDSSGVKIQNQEYIIDVVGNGKLFTVDFNEKINCRINKKLKKEKGIIEISETTNKNQIQISDITFEEEEQLKEKRKKTDDLMYQVIMNNLKELKRKNKSKIRDIELDVNEYINIYQKNSYKNFDKIVQEANLKLNEILGGEFLSKEKRLKKIMNDTMIKSMCNLRRDKREDTVFTDIKLTYINLFKTNAEIMKLDSKNHIRYIHQLILIMKKISKLSDDLRKLKKLKNKLKIELSDLIEYKLEELVNIVRLDEDTVEEIIQKIDAKALVSSTLNAVNRMYQKEELYLTN